MTPADRIAALEAEVAESRAVTDWMLMAIRGEELGDFAESFQPVRMAQDLRQREMAAESSLAAAREEAKGLAAALRALRDVARVEAKNRGRMSHDLLAVLDDADHALKEKP